MFLPEEAPAWAYFSRLSRCLPRRLCKTFGDSLSPCCAAYAAFVGVPFRGTSGGRPAGIVADQWLRQEVGELGALRRAVTAGRWRASA